MQFRDEISALVVRVLGKYPARIKFLLNNVERLWAKRTSKEEEQMTDSHPNVVAVKNEWLFNQVEVEFPTPESLKGRAIYQSLCKGNHVRLWSDITAETSFNLDDIFLVDFHRLTIMFSLLQASRVNDEQQRELLIEFFTQIIFSEPCYLYVGFHQSEPVAAAIITQSDDQLLVSDIVMQAPDSLGSRQEFASAVVTKWCNSHDFEGSVYIEE